MNSRIAGVAAVAMLCPLRVLFAEPADEVRAAIARLEDSPNYAWRMTRDVHGSFSPTYRIEGRLQKDGYVVIEGIRLDRTLTTVSYADRAVFQTDYGWISRKEIVRLHMKVWLPSAMTPAQELRSMLEACPILSKSGNVYAGVLDEGEAEKFIRLHVPDGESRAKLITRPTTTDFQIWVSNGHITKYELHFEGSLPDKRPTESSMTTEISDVGTTTVNVPEDAKAALKKLGKT